MIVKTRNKNYTNKMKSFSRYRNHPEIKTQLLNLKLAIDRVSGISSLSNFITALDKSTLSEVSQHKKIAILTILDIESYFTMNRENYRELTLKEGFSLFKQYRVELNKLLKNASWKKQKFQTGIIYLKLKNPLPREKKQQAKYNEMEMEIKASSKEISLNLHDNNKNV